jgi:hypothetical protein
MKMTFKYQFINLEGQLIAETVHSINEDSLADIMQSFRLFLLGSGFHPDSVDKYIEAN